MGERPPDTQASGDGPRRSPVEPTIFDDDVGPARRLEPARDFIVVPTGPGGTLIDDGRPSAGPDMPTLLGPFPPRVDLVPRPLPSVPGYAILGEVGRGGMGVVYKARRILLDRVVALKMVLAPEHAGTTSAIRFLTEAEAVARLQHPNIVQIHHIDEHDGHPYFEMEYVAGGNLADRLDGSPWKPRVAVRLAEKLARAMAEAHRLGVVHRDLKPANVLLTPDGTPKVADFGLAKRLDIDSELTQTESILGSPSYMAPEQAEGKARAVAAPADIYALGVILYELLVGRPPFRGATVLDTLRQVRETEPVHPSRLVPGLPHDVETIVLRCLEKDPARRYPSAEALADDLARFDRDEPILARRVGVGERARRWCRRHPDLAGLVTALAASVIVGMIGVTSLWLRADKLRIVAEARRQAAIKAIVVSERQRHVADLSAAEALKRGREADEQREAVRAEKEVTRKNLYLARMQLAQSAFNEPRGLNRMNSILDAWMPADPGTPDLRNWEWFHLKGLPPRNVDAPQHQRSPLCRVAWSPDGTHLAASRRDGTVAIFDRATRRQVRSLVGPPGSIGLMSYSPDGRRLAVPYSDGYVRVFDTSTGDPIDPFKGIGGPAVAAAYRPDGKSLATLLLKADRSRVVLQLRDPETGRVLEQADHAPGMFHALAWSPDSSMIARDSGLGEIIVSDGDELRDIKRWTAHRHSITSLSWSPDGERLASTSTDHAAKIWAPTEGKLIGDPLIHAHIVMTASWEPDGRRLATAGSDTMARVWDAGSGRQTIVLKATSMPIGSVAWHPDGSEIAIGILDDGSKIDHGAIDEGGLLIWQPLAGQVADHLEVAQLRSAPAWSPDGTRLALPAPGAGIFVWDVARRTRVLVLDGHSGVVPAIAWSRDGSRIASAGVDKTIRIWEASTGQMLRTIPAPDSEANTLSWSPDGRRLALGVSPNSVRIVAGDGVETRTLAGHSDIVRSAQWSPDGTRIATGSEDGTVRLWDDPTGRELACMRGHGLAVTWVAWSPDGGRLASSSSDMTARIWDVATGKTVLILRNHGDWMGGITWSPDGSRIAAANLNDSVRIWDVATGQEALTLRGDLAWFEKVAWSPDGMRIAASERNGRLWIWDAVLGYRRDRSPRALPELDARIAAGATPEDLDRRGEILARVGRWAESARDLAEAVERKPDDLALRGRLLLASRSAGDRSGYRAAAAALLERFGREQDGLTVHDASWSLARLSDSIDDADALIRLAERAVKLAKPRQKASALVTLGMCLARAGRYKGGDRPLRGSDPGAGGPDLPRGHRRPDDRPRPIGARR